jgi:glutaminase
MKMLTKNLFRPLLAAVLFICICVAPLQAAADIDAVLKAAYDKYKNLEEGANADYIPALAKVDPNVFGIVLVTVDGDVYSVGDIKTEVSIQSISKVFTMARVMEESGTDVILNNMGVDATGQVFNSIVAIEQYKGQQMNALVNPGAITATSMIKGVNENEVWGTIIGTYNDPIVATDIYTRQCSVGVNTKDLATMAATLANGGKNPVTGKKVLSSEHIAEVLAVMATAGLYDDSGQWLYKTGLPAKSGVGGGIIAVSPGKFGIAAISPPLDPAGNSVRAQKAIADISNALCGNPYEPVRDGVCDVTK